MRRHAAPPLAGGRSLDLALLRLLRTRGHARPAERAVAAFSRLGEHGAAWLVLAGAAALVDRPRRRVYARAAGTVTVAYVANIAIKLGAGRERPRLEGLPPLSRTLTGLSCPSAHAATSFAAARSLSAVLPAPPLYATAAAMALSRPYLGLHYPSDSVAGAVLGLVVAEILRERI